MKRFVGLMAIGALLCVESFARVSVWQIGGTWMTHSGRSGAIAVPGDLVGGFGVFPQYQPKHLTHFTISVGPNSQRRGCQLVTSGQGGGRFTGVDSPWHGLETTRYQSQANGTYRPGWLDVTFVVNGGRGAPVTAIRPSFARTGFRGWANCYYEVRVYDESFLPAVDPREPAVYPLPERGVDSGDHPSESPSTALRSAELADSPEAASKQEENPKLFPLNEALEVQKEN